MKPLLTPIIFCGPGTNLYPLCDAASSTSSSTKALLPLANRPMLAFALQSVLSAGFSHCLVLAHSAHHQAIVRSLSHLKLVCPPAVQGVTPSERKRAAKEAKEERGSIPIQFVDVTATAAAAKDEGMLHYAMTSSAVASMSVELLPLGPHDVSTSGMTTNGSHASGDVDEKTINLRFGPLGTAELLRWLDSRNKLHSDPLILPVDLVAPAFPLRDLIDAYVQAQARRPHAPTVCCALYERGAGEGVGREREREGPPRLISAFSTDGEASSSSSSAASHRLLFLRDSDLSEDLAIRRSLLTASPRTRISTSLLDAHAYILNKAHVLPLLRANPNLTSLRDHVIPLIAKASWQRGLREKVGWRLEREQARDGDRSNDELDADIDTLREGLQHSQSMTMDADALQEEAIARSSRLPASTTTISATRHVETGGKAEQDESIDCIAVVIRLNEDSQISGHANFIARANTVATYLECNRWLLKALSAAGEMLPAMAVPEEAEQPNGTTSGITTTTTTTITTPNNNNNSSSATSSLSSTATSQANDVQNQATTIASSAQISQDSLLGRGVRVGDRASVKRSVVGNHCEIGRGARLAGCILMDHVKVGENAKLENVICCVSSAIGERSTLKDCDVAASVTIAAETNAKNEKLVGEQESDEDDEEGYAETGGKE